jgi:ATP-dependent helicase HrpB
MGANLIPLPIDEFLPEILRKFGTHQNMIISASPGAGKTTRLPPELLGLTDKKTLVLEPRRIAAIASADRIASERGWTLGKEIGYQVRFDSQMSAETRLIFLTEALLGRKLLGDPTLKDVGIVVLDEFHERAVHVDLALGLLKELQELERPDLKIVVMSATLNADQLVNFLPGSFVAEVPGKIFPLETHLLKTSQLLQTNFDFIERVAERIRQAAAAMTATPSMATSASARHCMVFLPGVGEIERVRERVSEFCEAQNLELHVLHGSLNLDEQRRVLKPSEKSKIILSTNIAESSLTIDGVDTVIDCGLARQTRLDAKTGFSKLELVRISKASATQRAGRAARQFPGRVFRLWSSADELSMPAHDLPEIHRTPLDESLLFLSHLGVRDFQNFSWIETPKKENLRRAELELKSLGLLSAENELTPLGRRVARFPLPPRLGKLMALAQDAGAAETGAELCALLLEKDFLRDEQHSLLECDLLLRRELWLRRDRRLHVGQLRQLEKVKSQLQNLAGSSERRSFSEDLVRELLLLTFSDRLSRRRRAGQSQALMIGGRGLALDTQSCVRQSEFFVALELMETGTAETRCRKACGIPLSMIEKFWKDKIMRQSEVIFDEASQKVLREDFRALTFSDTLWLPLENAKTHPATAGEAERFLPQIAFLKRDLILQKNPALGEWWRRYLYFCAAAGEESLGEDEQKQIWTTATYGEVSLEKLFDKDLIFFFEQALSSGQKKKLHEEFPSHLIVPSGSRMKLEYEPGKNPSLQVRLQEIFGWKETPKVGGGKIPVTLVLTGPNYRPVQITQDLASFWKNGYPEVRKELRLKYPKHSWPEDPLTAVAVAKGPSQKR